MRKIFILLAFFIASSSAIEANDNIQRLIQEGIELHGAGEFQRAIEKYNEVLRIDSTNISAIYEISLSYLALSDYENAIKFSTKVINSNDQTLSVGAYAIKSEALAATDRVDDAIELLERGLERHGNEYLLHFNLALKYYRKNDLDNAITHVRKAIDLDKSHSEAFLLYAHTLNDKEMWVRSILVFQMFLLLEPDTQRSKAAFKELLRTMRIDIPSEAAEPSFIQQQMMRNPAQTGRTVLPNEIPPLSAENGVNRYQIYNVIVSTLDSLRAEALEDDLFTIFKTVNREIITQLDQQNDGSEGRTGKFWTFYVPFFAQIVKSEHYETFCRYISVSYLSESLEWWNDNPDYAESFVIWFEEGDEIENRDEI
jgi:tetratricopeptide (TPR) repeat protein